MRETSKCHDDRLNNGTYLNYLNGYGIDICPADGDYLQYPNANILHYTKPRESAMHMIVYSKNQFNFVYASHILSEMEYPDIALSNWIRICKPGGYIYVVVPESNYYLQGQWPCKWNKSHKWNFTLDNANNLPNNIIVNSWIRQFSNVRFVSSFKNIQNWDSRIPHGEDNSEYPYRVDQTYEYNNNVILNIEFILQKI